MEDLTKIFCDGGSRGNPGKSAAAFVVEEKGNVIYSEAKYLGIATNNFAEYSAVLLALRWIAAGGLDKENKIVLGKKIVFILDSELVARQINGVYKVKNKRLKGLFLEIEKILKSSHKEIIFKNVAREKNKLADSLVNKTLDNVL